MCLGRRNSQNARTVHARFGLAVLVPGLAVIVGCAPALCIALHLTLFQTCLGCLNCSQARLPALDFNGDVQIGLVGLGLVGMGRLPER